jgi:hypothetical protein
MSSHSSGKDFVVTRRRHHLPNPDIRLSCLPGYFLGSMKFQKLRRGFRGTKKIFYSERNQYGHFYGKKIKANHRGTKDTEAWQDCPGAPEVVLGSLHVFLCGKYKAKPDCRIVS